MYKNLNLIAVLLMFVLRLQQAAGKVTRDQVQDIRRLLRDRETKQGICELIAGLWLKHLRSIGVPLQFEAADGSPVIDLIRYIIEMGIANEWAFVKYLIENLPALIEMIMLLFGGVTTADS